MPTTGKRAYNLSSSILQSRKQTEQNQVENPKPRGQLSLPAHGSRIRTPLPLVTCLRGVAAILVDFFVGSRLVVWDLGSRAFFV